MKKLIKISYFLRITLLFIQFYFVFNMIGTILDTKYVGVIFILLYLFYVLVFLSEIMSKKKKYQKDLVYNCMQIGLYLYLIVLSIKINYYNVYVNNSNNVYFFVNYGILCILIIFIIIYSLIEFKGQKKSL